MSATEFSVLVVCPMAYNSHINSFTCLKPFRRFYVEEQQERQAHDRGS